MTGAHVPEGIHLPLGIHMPEWLKHLVNVITGPQFFFVLSLVAFVAVLRYYRALTKPAVAGMIAVGAALFFLLACTDPHFKSIAVDNADNVPIAALLAVVGFFLWLALRQAALNDERIAKGLPPREKEESKINILVWPDLVYGELICSVLVTVFLIVWSIVLKAPLEQPANPANTPNPSKAPWYFLGLQEMLVYFDPWLAGVVLPGLIIVGLIAIPFMDRNPKGNGYYTLAERPFAIRMFLFGFVNLWVLLVIQGTFLRGPNWNFFGPLEPWDPHKVLSLNNVNLSEFFWVELLKRTLPENWLLRELPGILLVLGYFAIVPALLAATLFKKFFRDLGFVRYSIMVFLFLGMGGMLLKMFFRWTINLKYVVAIPEFFFNI